MVVSGQRSGMKPQQALVVRAGSPDKQVQLNVWPRALPARAIASRIKDASRGWREIGFFIAGFA